jgi:DNA polymerase-3 subunit alpha
MSIEQYLDGLTELGIQRASLTDTHNLFGAFKFFQAARERAIDPVLGIDLLVRSNDHSGWTRRDAPLHLLVYVKNRDGYERLSELVSASYRKRRDRGDLYVPTEKLSENTDDLLFLGPPASSSSSSHVEGNPDSFREKIRAFREQFGPNVGVEIPIYRNGDRAIDTRLSVCHDMGLQPIPTHPTYFPGEADVETLKIRRAIQTNTSLEELEELPGVRADQYLMSAEEFLNQPGIDETLLKGTVSWTEECTFRFETDRYHLPEYPYGKESSHDLLVDRCQTNFNEKTVDTDEDRARERLDHELETIRDMGFSDYFLIVADVVNWARKNGIRVGPGRGSAAGSFVAYLMNITTVDPFKYDLIFERFLNPDRNEMPDIDVDFADHDRERVLRYIRDRFGAESVAHIITFGRMKARNSIRDVGRVRNEDQETIDALAESVPPTSDRSLQQLVEDGKILDSDVKQHQDWIEQAIRVEGFVRNPSIHAAGILIAEGDIDRALPLYRDSGKDDLVASQFDMYDIEALGYLKLDVLGLTTLSLLDKTLEQLPPEERPDLESLPETDEATLGLFAERKLEGVFQFEAHGGRRLAEQMEPNSKREVIDCIALNRPGPAQYRDDYLKRRSGESSIEYPHEDLKPVLEDTYGLIIYQEQVMAIARIIGNLSWSESDVMRKAMGKKKTGLMEQLRTKFVEGADDQGYDRQFAKDLFEKLAQFAEYGFNRSHSAAYGEITYQTAYLKAHFPEEFYAAFLTLKSSDRDRVRTVIRSMRDEGVKILPPDVNESNSEFHVESEGVRYGLSAIKHVGTDLAEVIVDRRTSGPFTDLDDFLSRIPPSLLTAGAFKALAAAGSFERLSDRNRGTLIDNADELIQRGKKAFSENQSGQSTLFDRGGTRQTTEESNWSKERLKNAEREALGLSISQ